MFNKLKSKLGKGIKYLTLGSAISILPLSIAKADNPNSKIDHLTKNYNYNVEILLKKGLIDSTSADDLYFSKNNIRKLKKEMNDLKKDKESKKLFLEWESLIHAYDSLTEEYNSQSHSLVKPISKSSQKTRFYPRDYQGKPIFRYTKEMWKKTGEEFSNGYITNGIGYTIGATFTTLNDAVELPVRGVTNVFAQIPILNKLTKPLDDILQTTFDSTFGGEDMNNSFARLLDEDKGRYPLWWTNSYDAVKKKRGKKYPFRHPYLDGIEKAWKMGVKTSSILIPIGLFLENQFKDSSKKAIEKTQEKVEGGIIEQGPEIGNVRGGIKNSGSDKGERR